MVQNCVQSRTQQVVRFHPTSPAKLQVGDCVRFSERWLKTLGGIMTCGISGGNWNIVSSKHGAYQTWDSIKFVIN